MSHPYRDPSYHSGPHFFYDEDCYINLDAIVEMWRRGDSSWGVFFRGNPDASDLENLHGLLIFDALKRYREG